MNLIRISLAVLICFLALSVWGCDSIEPEEEIEPEPVSEIEMAFVLIKAGTFEMGEISACCPDERPIHSITLTRDFFIGKYEVTQGEYEALMDNNPSWIKDSDRHPVENVTWINAIKLANALSEQDEYQPCYDASGNVIDGGGNVYRCEGYRLPTEAEWEYATRAGTKTKWSHGNDKGHLRAYAVIGGQGGTLPVGSLKPNPWGLYDVHGNVWEWVNDWYAESYYSRSPSVDPQGSETGTERVARGGSWTGGNDVRSAARASFNPWSLPPDGIPRNYGFRLARTAE